MYGAISQYDNNDNDANDDDVQQQYHQQNSNDNKHDARTKWEDRGKKRTKRKREADAWSVKDCNMSA